MRTYVIYDIVKDRIRKKIADICLDYGLERIQYSAFLGNINTTRWRALEEKLAAQLGKTEGKSRSQREIQTQRGLVDSFR